jgi:hypothetical protein
MLEVLKKQLECFKRREFGARVARDAFSCHGLQHFFDLPPRDSDAFCSFLNVAIATVN